MKIKKIIAALLTAIVALSLTPAVISAANEALNTSDALVILRHAAGTVTLRDSELSRYDINGDGRVDTTDALFVLQIAAGMRSPDGIYIPILNSSGNNVAKSYEEIYRFASRNRDRVLANATTAAAPGGSAPNPAPNPAPAPAPAPAPNPNTGSNSGSNSSTRSSLGGGGGGGGGGGSAGGAPGPSAAPAPAPAPAPEPWAVGVNAPNPVSNFSDTNNQVAGIQEGDIIKTDGNHIYLASTLLNNINVIRVNNGNMHRVALLEKRDARPVELLLYNSDLIVIWDRSTVINTTITIGNRLFSRQYTHHETIVEVYSANGRYNQPASSYTQDGKYVSSRMIDNNIYLITNYSPNMYSNFTARDYNEYVPSYSINSRGFTVTPGRIVIPESLDNVHYTVISGLDVSRPNMLVSIKASLESTNVIYSSHENIYITSPVFTSTNPREESTIINKFSIDRGRIEYVAANKVRGNVGNQFYLDEYRGTLRLVTQVWGNGANGRWRSFGGSLYTFDRNLRTLAAVHGIGGNEEVHSVRFAEEIGYVVTFLVTDPLFSFDLSNPSNPRILDELKIPGFSRYMHKWSDDLLLGVGVDANERTGIRTGLKLSMFDIGDNENLSERHIHVIGSGNQGRYSSIAEHEHRAILVSPEKNIIAFPYTYQINNLSSHSNTTVSVYAIFSYDKQRGFTLIGEIRNENSSSDFLRGLFIGDYIYAASDNKVVSARIHNPVGVQTFSLER